MGPLAPVLFIGPLLFFLAPFFTTSFHFSTFSFPEGRSTEQTHKRRFAGYDPHMNFFRFPIDGLLFHPSCCFSRNSPCQREKERARPAPFSSLSSASARLRLSGQRERRKKGVISISFSGWVKRDLFGQRENWGTTLGKAENQFFFREGVFVRIFCSLFPFPHFIVFSSTAPREGKKNHTPTDTTASNRETARVQGGMDREPVIRASFLFISDFFLEGDRSWVLGFGLEWD